jgi:hypothetical protein
LNDSEWEDAVAYLERTKSNKPAERKLALKEMCPCHVKKDFDVIWDRVFEMVNDPDENVRYQVVVCSSIL